MKWACNTPLTIKYAAIIVAALALLLLAYDAGEKDPYPRANPGGWISIDPDRAPEHKWRSKP